MSNSSKEQQELNASIKKGATIWAVIIGLVTAGLVYWIMGSQSTIIRMGAGAVGGVAVAIAMYRKSLASASAQSADQKEGQETSSTKGDSSSKE